MKLLEKIFYTLLLAGLLLQPVVALSADTDLAQQLFDKAIEQRESGDVFSAIEIFETILATSPDLNRARLELAVAYHQASQYQAAMRELKTVLDAPDTPENVRLSILAYLGQVSNDEKKPEGSHNFSYYLKAGLLSNSNLNASQAISTGLNTVSSAKVSSVGTDLVASASHRYSKKRLLDFVGSTTAFEWHSQATISSNVYEKLSDFNLHVASISTGPALISPGRWRASAFMRADYIVLGSDALATFISVSPTITFDLGNFNSMMMESSFTTHNYDDIANAGYDGNAALYGIGYTVYLPQHATGLEVGIRISNNDADDDAFSYDLNEIYAAGFYAATGQSNVYLKLKSRSYDYVAIDPSVGVIRDESETNIALGYNYDYHNGWLQGWTLNIEFSSIDSDSNADTLDYTRNLLSVNLSKYFN
jgi:tetratricopeptide (TPR) repeat protein